jgi:hypothetical protein
MPVAIPSTFLQETSCREALPSGPFPSVQEPDISWCHSCWHASADKAGVDAECTFKGTRFLHSDQHGAWSFKTSYEHLGPAPELTFHDDWKPSKPHDNHKKVLKVSASWHATHRLLTPRQSVLQTLLLPILLTEMQHCKRVGDDKKSVIAVERDIGMRDICGVYLVCSSLVFF